AVSGHDVSGRPQPGLGQRSMIRRLSFVPFATPRDRAGRLVRISLALAALILLALWNPTTRPGPVLCLMRHAVALPCPFCGVTRGVSLTLHGAPVAGSRFNPLTLPVLVLGVGLIALWSVEYARNRRLALALSPLGKIALTLLLLAILGLTWRYLL